MIMAVQSVRTPQASSPATASGMSGLGPRCNGAVSAHRNFTEGARFVPFSVVIAGGFAPQAEKFVETGVEWAGNVRDVSVFG
jgi:hypothetical protein